jgi:hypothetical protein
MFTCLKTQKSFLIALIFVLLLTVSACSVLGGQTTEEAPAPAEPVQADTAEAGTAPVAAPTAETQTQAQAAPAPAGLDGNWANEDPAAPGITRMTFRSEGSTVYVQMWTHCDAEECTWEEQGVPLATPLEVSWKTGVATNLQTITLLEDGRLQVEEKIQFTDGSGRGDVGMTSYLNKQ